MIVGRNFLINLLEMTKTYENTRKIACVQIDIAQSVASCLIDQPYFNKRKKKKKKQKGYQVIGRISILSKLLI